MTVKAAIRQSSKSKLCGQIAVAVLADITLAEALALVGHGDGTKTRDLVVALRKLGFSCPDRLRRMTPPSLGIGRLTLPGTRNWHWVVVADGWIIDGRVRPFAQHGWPLDDLVDAYAASGKRITSWLPVSR